MRLAILISHLLGMGTFAIGASLIGNGTLQDKDFVDPDPDGKLAHAERMVEAEKRRVLSNLVSRLAKAEKFLKLDSETAELLELSNDQKKDLELLKEDYAEKLLEAFPKLPGAAEADYSKMYSSDEYSKLNREEREELNQLREGMLIAITEILVSQQLDKLTNMDSRFGLPRMLLFSPAGKMLDLSEAQQNKIRRQSHQLFDDITEFSEKARSKAEAIIEDTLDDDQLQQLEDIVGEDYLKNYPPKNWPLEHLGAFHRLEEEAGSK